jgi:hypothetical protein
MTTMLLILVGVVTLVTAGIVRDVWRSGRVLWSVIPKPFEKRHSQEFVWRQRYPEERLATADTVLRMVCDAFTFNPDHRYQFAPDDRVQDIYRALYPWWKLWQLGDMMEIVSLVSHLSGDLGIDISQEYPNITLGDIVERAGKPK